MPHPRLASRFHTTRRVTSAALTLLFLIQTTGCRNGWHPVTNPIPMLANTKSTDYYRVTLANGKVVQLTKRRVHGDSVFGMTDSMKVVRGGLEVAPYLMGFPMTQMTHIERHSVSANVKNSLVAPAVMVTGFCAVVVVISAADGGLGWGGTASH
jgi:hypothetical protein